MFHRQNAKNTKVTKVELSERSEKNGKVGSFPRDKINSVNPGTVQLNRQRLSILLNTSPDHAALCARSISDCKGLVLSVIERGASLRPAAVLLQVIIKTKKGS